MATSVSSSDAGALDGIASSPGDHGSAVAPFAFAGVDPDENLAAAEDGAAGVVGPIMGAQHMPNAAQPGSMTI